MVPPTPPGSRGTCGSHPAPAPPSRVQPGPPKPTQPGDIRFQQNNPTNNSHRAFPQEGLSGRISKRRNASSSPNTSFTEGHKANFFFFFYFFLNTFLHPISSELLNGGSPAGRGGERRRWVSPTRQRMLLVWMLPGANTESSWLRALRSKANLLSVLRLLSKALPRRPRGATPLHRSSQAWPPAWMPRCPEAMECSGATAAPLPKKRVTWRCKRGEGKEKESLGGRGREREKPSPKPSRIGPKTNPTTTTAPARVSTCIPRSPPDTCTPELPRNHPCSGRPEKTPRDNGTEPPASRRSSLPHGSPAPRQPQHGAASHTRSL